MSTQNSSQSQPSYLLNIQRKSYCQIFSPLELVDQLSATLAINRLVEIMMSVQGPQFQQCFSHLSVLFQKGYSYLLTTHPLILRKMMNHFTKLGKQIQVKDQFKQIEKQNSKVQARMVYVLSIIAELLRNNPKYYYPFTRKFLITLFTIDSQLLEKSIIKNNILAILSFIYENVSRQPKLVTKYGIQNNLKFAILDNYRLIEQITTLKMMNKAISNLVSKGIYFSVAQFHKFSVLNTVSNIIAKNQLDLFLTKMKMTMLTLSASKISQESKGNIQNIQFAQHTQK